MMGRNLGVAGGIDFDALAEWAGEEVARDALIESGYDSGFERGVSNGKAELALALRPLLDKIQACGYSCQAGPLDGNLAWRKLRVLVSEAAA